MNQTATVSPLLSSALSYAARGWPVFPLYYIVNGKCSCGKYSCPQAGKHPCVKEWDRVASTDPDIIKSWWRRWPNANIAVKTGNGLIVVDVDPKHNGAEGLAALENKHEKLPPTLLVTTGSQGWHLYYTADEEIRNSASRLAPGVDIRGDGGYVVAPPSNHISGNSYEWNNELPLAVLPQWARVNPPREVLGPMPDKVIEGGRNTLLFKHACKFRAQGLNYSEILAALREINASRCSPPLDDAELATMTNSASKYAPGPSPKTSDVPELHADNNVDDELWIHGLRFNANQKLIKTTANAALYLIHHKAWAGKLAYDEFAGKYIWKDHLPHVEGFKTPPPGEAHDVHYSYVQQWLLANAHATHFPESTVCTAISMAARERSFHPVREYLTGLRWDKVPRVSRWLHTYLGVDDTPYSRRVGQWWLISAVARIMNPGEKVDSMLIFESHDQGKGKSTATQVLGGKWFSDTPIPLGNKDAYSNIQGLWIVELAELEALKGARSSQAKAFFSSREDRFRPAFERATRSFPRQCVFVGTINEGEYLHDPTGGRRYWPVYCNAIDIQGLIRDRDMLWAETVEMYEAGNRWYPETDEDKRLCKAEQEKRYAVDPWEELISQYVENLQETTVADILTHLGVTRDRWEQQTQNRVAVCLKRLHWINKPTMRNGHTVRVYTRT